MNVSRITAIRATVAGLLVVTLFATAGSGQVDEEPEVPQKVLVLLNGRVITGDVQDRPGGYLIDNRIGKIVIPFTQVRLTARDLPEAYRKLKQSMTEPTASGHLSLGEWCFENRLYDSAREQVKAALLLEPERKEGRALLKQIERMTLGDAVEATVEIPERTRDGFEAGQAESLDGLSPSVTQEFVRRIQPLLLNKCGNARCHGVAGTSDFRLAPVRLGRSGYRNLTDQNLSAVLQVIDSERPRNSPILRVAQGAHGGQRALWTGPRADDQLAGLRAWVTRVALDQGAVASETIDQGDQSQTEAASIRRDPFLQRILAEERPDQFDPEVFNRMMHGNE